MAYPWMHGYEKCVIMKMHLQGKRVKDVRFDNIKLNDNTLADRLNSYQFKLSQDIFGKRISLNISRNEAAKLTGLTEDEYTKIEQGIDLKSSKGKYQSVLTKLINASKPH